MESQLPIQCGGLKCDNSFPISPQKHPHNNTTRLQSTQMTKSKWVTFTYAGKETLYITNAFKHTDLKIAFRTNNTIENLLKHRNPISDKFSSSGVSKLTCPDCRKAYVGQTGRRFYTQYNKHKSAFHHNNRTSNFAKHLHDNLHSFGPINNIVQVLHHQKEHM